MYPVTIRNSLIELRSECKKNSRNSDDMSCIWLELGACTKALLKAIIAVILGPGARVILVKTYVNIPHRSPKLGSWHGTESWFESSLSQLWQNNVSLDTTFAGHTNELPDKAHAILPRASRTSHFFGSSSSAKE